MWAEIQETLSNLDLALSEAKARGLEYSRPRVLACASAKSRLESVSCISAHITP